VNGRRQRRRVALVSVAAIIGTGLASLGSTLLVELGCVANANTAACLETEGGKVGLVRVLLAAGPPLLTAVAGAEAIRRRRLWPVLAAASVLVPLGFLLPPLVWE
jgi:hypothetical protein